MCDILIYNDDGDVISVNGVAGLFRGKDDILRRIDFFCLLKYMRARAVQCMRSGARARTCVCVCVRARVCVCVCVCVCRFLAVG